MRRALTWTGVLIAGCTWSNFALAQLPAGMTLTCKFTNGPLAGSEKDFSSTPGATPAVIGTLCTDGLYSSGIAVTPNRNGSAAGLDPDQIKLMRETAHSICTTVKEAIGKKTTAEIAGEVRAKLGGVIGKITDIGGSATGKMGQESFEGLTQDATAEALRGDQQCRERIFNKMFDKISFSKERSKIYVSIEPDTVGMRSGDYRSIIYSFKTNGLSKILIETQDAQWRLLDGRSIGEDCIGCRILGGSFDIPNNLSHKFVDNVYLPPDLVSRMREKSATKVNLRTTFHGTDDNGVPVKATAVLLIVPVGQ